MDAIAYQPVSLGHTCEVKFQIARRLNLSGHPGHSEMRFRLDMAPPQRGARYFRWDMFDWLGISLNSVCAYIERDFEGVFERADLELREAGLWNRLFGVNHIHDFEDFGGLDPDGSVSPGLLDTLYTGRLRAYAARAEAFRRLLESPGPVLYVHQCNAYPNEAEAVRLVAALRSRSAAHRFHVLFTGYPETTTDLSALGDLVSTAPRSRLYPKPKGREWEGDDQSWDEILGPFTLRPEEPAPAALAEPPASRQGLLARMLGR